MRILSGEFKGEEVVVYNHGMDNPVYGIHVTQGDGVIVALQKWKMGLSKKPLLPTTYGSPGFIYPVFLFILALMAIGGRRERKPLFHYY